MAGLLIPMNPAVIGPMCELAGTDAEMVAVEMKVAEKLVVSTAENSTSSNNLLLIYQSLQKWKEAFPGLMKTVAAALTFASSDAICERGFSALSRVHSDFRRSMSNQRLSHLTLLAFEKAISSSITFERFLAEFRQKPRRLLV